MLFQQAAQPFSNPRIRLARPAASGPWERGPLARMRAGRPRSQAGSRHLLGLTLLGLALLALGACGFQLRGWDQHLGLESVYLDARPQVSATAPLRRALRQAGAQLAPSAADAQLRVELLDERRDRRTVSVAGGAVAAEYELTLAVRYAIRADAAQPGDPRWAEASRVYAIDRDSVAGSAEEQALIEVELMEEIVQEILRALNAAAGSVGEP